jgi:hypothetical protein
MKHTPGPWTLETVRTSCGICHKVGPFPGKRKEDKPRHACLYADYPSKGNPPDDELEANARLIAAAPELLAALKAVLDRDELNTCQHEDTYRGGAIWEICNQCGSKWADDEGGKPEWKDPAEWDAAYKAIAKAEGTKP